MLRFTLIGFAALGLIVGGVSAQSKMDCGKAYKSVWDKLKREENAKISDQQLADVNRLALRAYDACQAGDEQTALGLFERVALLTNEWGKEPSTGPFNPNLPR
jgi:hypothetical protein